MKFYEDETGSNGYWDFAYSIALGLINDGVAAEKNLEMIQESIYNLLKYKYNDELKDVVKLIVDDDGCIAERKEGN